jgi:ribonuclease HI
MEQITITTDGACRFNVGPGGWACSVRDEQQLVEQAGGCLQTTVNRMELQAAIEGLKALKEPCEVLLISDSRYLLDGVTSRRQRWRVNGWMIERHGRTYPLANLDLWLQLDELAQKHVILGQWVKSHSAHPDHERCEQLASAQAAQFPQVSCWAGLGAKIMARRTSQPFPAA